MIDSNIFDLIIRTQREHINIGKLSAKLGIDDKKTYKINVKWFEENVIEELTEMEARKIARDNRGYWSGYDLIKVKNGYHKVEKTNHDVCNIVFYNNVTLGVYDRNNIHIFDNNIKLGVKMIYDNEYTRSLVKIVEVVCEAYKQKYKNVVEELKAGHSNHRIYLNVLEDITKEPQIENSL